MSHVQPGMGTPGHLLRVIWHQCHQLSPCSCWDAIKTSREHRAVPQQCLREGLASGAQHTSLVPAELQLTSRDERHETSAPCSKICSCSSRNKARLFCGEHTASSHPALCRITSSWALIPPCCRHITSPKISAPLTRSQVDAGEERSHFIHTLFETLGLIPALKCTELLYSHF